MNGTNSSEAWRMIKSYALPGAHDSSVVNRVMLRFRPIAPKPATCPDGNGEFSSGEKLSSVLSSGRRKRKYVRVRRNSGYTRKKNNIHPRKNDVVSAENPAATTTLQLLPVAERSGDLDRPIKLDLALKCTRDPQGCSIRENPAGRVLAVQSLITVESVRGITCIAAQDNNRVDDDYNMIMSTDAEKVMRLDKDTCPGFVSDGSNVVVWVNSAFSKMVTKKTMELGVELVVGLVIKEKFSSFYKSFTGHVKLQYNCVHASGEASDQYSRVVPFDLWRMDGGGFAWRLDVEAALTLGRA